MGIPRYNTKGKSKSYKDYFAENKDNLGDTSFSGETDQKGRPKKRMRAHIKGPAKGSGPFRRNNGMFRKLSEEEKSEAEKNRLYFEVTMDARK